MFVLKRHYPDGSWKIIYKNNKRKEILQYIEKEGLMKETLRVIHPNGSYSDPLTETSSIATRRKISKSKLGKKCSEEHKRNISKSKIIGLSEQARKNIAKVFEK